MDAGSQTEDPNQQEWQIRQDIEEIGDAQPGPRIGEGMVFLRLWDGLCHSQHQRNRGGDADQHTMSPPQVRGLFTCRVLPNERGHVLDREAPLRQQRLVRREDVEHARPDLEGDIDAGLLGPGCGAHTVISDDLVLACLDQQWWEAAIVGQTR